MHRNASVASKIYGFNCYATLRRWTWVSDRRERLPGVLDINNNIPKFSPLDTAKTITRLPSRCLPTFYPLLSMGSSAGLLYLTLVFTYQNYSQAPLNIKKINWNKMLNKTNVYPKSNRQNNLYTSCLFACEHSKHMIYYILCIIWICFVFKMLLWFIELFHSLTNDRVFWNSLEHFIKNVFYVRTI